MKYTSEMKDALKKRILINADNHPQDLVQYAVKNLALSKNTVIKYIDELIKDGKLIRTNIGRYPYYKLKSEITDLFFQNDKKLSEEQMIAESYNFIGKLPFEISQIFDYTFMEIANNAIEHSESKNISVRLEKTVTKLKVNIKDDGIGIFNKIKNDLNLLNDKQAIIELSKGKFTSNPEHHSGEGIFFSSKLCDEFYIKSGTLIYSPLEKIPKDILDIDCKTGTQVIFVINFDTKKSAKQIFEEFAGSDFDNPQFKTIIQLRFMQMEGMTLTSRSQARRLLTRLEKFTSVVLDFSEVNFIGQAFADEIFRVYRRQNPKTKLEVENANSEIQTMIAHVER